MKNRLFSVPLALVILIISFYSCAKVEEFPDAGGKLPSNYIVIQADGSVSPSLLRVASGSSITFVNNDSKAHRIVSNDSLGFASGEIAPKAFHYFKNDALAGVYSYKCTMDTTLKGTIIFTP